MLVFGLVEKIRDGAPGRENCKSKVKEACFGSRGWGERGN